MSHVAVCLTMGANTDGCPATDNDANQGRHVAMCGAESKPTRRWRWRMKSVVPWLNDIPAALKHRREFEAGSASGNRARQAHGLPRLTPQAAAQQQVPRRGPGLLDGCEHVPHRAEHVLDLLLFDDERRRERDDVARIAHQNPGL
jgi:hypothetical protein